MPAQFNNKYAAQRALLRNGELLSPSLIIGVKVSVISMLESHGRTYQTGSLS